MLYNKETCHLLSFASLGFCAYNNDTKFSDQREGCKMQDTQALLMGHECENMNDQLNAHRTDAYKSMFGILTTKVSNQIIRTPSQASRSL